MARVRSGQARPGPWSLAGGGAEAPTLKGWVPKMLSAERFERIFGCLLTVEGHPRTLSGPSPDLSTARIGARPGGGLMPPRREAVGQCRRVGKRWVNAAASGMGDLACAG